jgi:hypothetical protein
MHTRVIHYLQVWPEPLTLCGEKKKVTLSLVLLPPVMLLWLKQGMHFSRRLNTTGQAKYKVNFKSKTPSPLGH